MIDPNKPLELRMYFFTSFYISPTQHGIQAGHCVEEYSDLYHDDPLYKEYRKHKTWIILNGGSTNNCFELGTGEPIGELNQIVEELQQNAIRHACFFEPGLNDALTAVCFICDERVWNYKDYPNFPESIINSNSGDISSQRIVEIKMTPEEELKLIYKGHYEAWVYMMGGEKNIFLRELIKGKKLA
jgi:hypothetical protein